MSENISKPSECPLPEPQEALSRRAFGGLALGSVGLCYAAAIGYPVYRYLASPAERAAGLAAVTEVTLADAHKLASGTALMFRFGTTPSMLIHRAGGEWVAFEAVCTHLGCTVQFEPDKNRIHCACHGGVYSPADGSNVSGPPPRPLKPYAVKVTDTGITISRG